MSDIRDPFERLAAGLCWDCGTTLEAEREADLVVCPDCGKRYTGFELLTVVLAS